EETNAEALIKFAKKLSHEKHLREIMSPRLQTPADPPFYLETKPNFGALEKLAIA
nr:acyl transferase/acyl hydrolase/lysophospholipase [Tanacetum cinerariifolium]